MEVNLNPPTHLGLVVAEHVDKLSPEEFTLLRKQGLGASDAAAYADLHPFKKRSALIAEKKCKTITDEDRKIGDLPQVRMGVDLEPLVLEKAKKALGFEQCLKPTNMYKVPDAPWLLINYDAIVLDEGDRYNCPVEIKVISFRGNKSFDLSKGNKFIPFHSPVEPDIRAYCKAASEEIGIPIYYFLQIQQQLMGTETARAFLAAWNTQDWALYLYVVPAVPTVQAFLKTESYKTWQEIQRI